MRIGMGAAMVLWFGLSGALIAAPATEKERKSEAKPAVKTEAKPVAKAEAKDAKKVAAELVGLWRTVSLQQDDEKMEGDEVARLVFVVTDKKIVMRRGTEAAVETAYRLDASQDPPTIELTFDGQETQGICLRSGNTLKLCLADKGKSRPKKFEIGKDGGQMLMVLRNADEERQPLYVMNADGTGFRPLVSMPDYTAVGSPAWSPDGKQLAFDAWRSVFGEEFNSGHIFTCNADGTGLRDLGPGLMPSWSPDGKRIAYSRGGVHIMNADGTNRETVDSEGWAIEWSPRGNRVAYTVHRDGNANIVVRDLDKKDDERLLLESEYQRVTWGMHWSPDGQWICFQGINNDGESQLAMVHTDGEAKGFKILLPKGMPGVRSIWATVAWGGEGRRLIVALMPPKSGPCQLYFVDTAEKEPPRLVPGQAADRSYVAPAWSMDGKKILLILRPQQKPNAG